MGRGRFVGEVSLLRGRRYEGHARSPLRGRGKGEWVRAVGLGTLLIVGLSMTAMLDQDSGVGIWLALRGDLAGAEDRVAVLVAQNDSLAREIELLEADPTAIDRAIREEMDLALPGEVVFRFVPAVDPAMALPAND